MIETAHTQRIPPNEVKTAHAQRISFNVLEDLLVPPTDQFTLTSGEDLAISHVATSYRRYAGEKVTLLTRIVVLRPLQVFRICITLPAELRLDGYQHQHGEALSSPQFTHFYLPDLKIPNGRGSNSNEDDGRWETLLGIAESNRSLQAIELANLMQCNELLLWYGDGALRPGDWYEFSLTATIRSNLDERIETRLSSHAFILLPSGKQNGTAVHIEQGMHPDDQIKRDKDSAGNLSEGTLTVEESKKLPPSFQHETAVITVFPKSAYLQYLPSLYEQDAFMNRFLMVFESLWQPREAVIDQIHTYFDHTVTSLPFLQWMASWFDFPLAMTLGEGELRRLLPQLLTLYQQRGTRSGLQKLLTIATGVKVTIEDRVDQLQLNPNIRFGMAPKVYTRVEPPNHFYVTAVMGKLTDVEQYQIKNKLCQLLDAEKPVHTSYTIKPICD